MCSPSPQLFLSAEQVRQERAEQSQGGSRARDSGNLTDANHAGWYVDAQPCLAGDGREVDVVLLGTSSPVRNAPDALRDDALEGRSARRHGLIRDEAMAGSGSTASSSCIEGGWTVASVRRSAWTQPCSMLQQPVPLPDVTPPASASGRRQPSCSGAARQHLHRCEPVAVMISMPGALFQNLAPQVAVFCSSVWAWLCWFKPSACSCVRAGAPWHHGIPRSGWSCTAFIDTSAIR